MIKGTNPLPNQSYKNYNVREFTNSDIVELRKWQNAIKELCYVRGFRFDYVSITNELAKINFTIDDLEEDSANIKKYEVDNYNRLKHRGFIK